MEDKVYKVKVEKMNRMQMFLFCMVIIFGSYGTSIFLEDKLGVRISGELILLAVIGILCFLIVKFERFFPTTEMLGVVFQEDMVIFRRGCRERKIRYNDIREVEKMMIINRYHSEKGYYRVKVKVIGRSYAMYSGEDSTKKLDFAETDISKVYFEFQNRGIKCC